MNSINQNNRVIVGVKRSDHGWDVFTSVSVNWGTWSTHRIDGHFTELADAEAKAYRLAQCLDFEGWQVSYDFTAEA